ncbi:PDZ domain-containing protein [Gemmata sp. G18]|uniref:PDZ domain-containing protein n=1 Tax=Gemmata palustris TaxID=2822762 RepID=A0ABS5BN42_9BACT|nr:PDZ domain-containing protein [Gemmata palustris]MBP3955132.1 PDZ domain-containing protein [Gemmata palustris]
MTFTVPRTARPWGTVVAAALLAAPVSAQPKPDINEATEKAMKAASAKVAPSLVKIETTGGAETVSDKKGAGPGIRKGVGPTTGLVVSPDGFIISSAFNFANKPANIFVTVPGRDRVVAKIVANDQSRMLTLLKIELKDLPVPDAVPKKDVEIGQWGLSLGRTLDNSVDHPPSMSAGIVSATNRIWGKAIQTDAKTSPVNYGGALVSIEGRVYGVIVPASNRAEGETAGVDVYDGGIGFAVPLEDVLASLPRLKAGQDLRRGLLGVQPKGEGVYNPAVIGAIQPDSAAARAGLQVNDKIVELNGKKVQDYSALQHILGPLYEGDEIALKAVRGDKEMEFKGIKLLGTTTAYVKAYLGILPMRDDPGPGVEVRFVYPKSPAEAAGIKVGDRIMKFGATAQPVQNRATFLAAIQTLTPGVEVKVEVKRKEGGKVETVSAKLTPVPDEVPEKLPLPSSAGKALEGQPKPKDPPKDPFPKDPFPPKGLSDVRADAGGQDEKKGDKKDEKKDKPKVETGYLTRTNEALGREYWVYIPDNYDPNVSHGLIVWFHPAGQGGKDGEKMSKTFRDFAEDNHFIVMGPKSNGADGWVASETELVVQDVKTVLGQYTIDRTRVVAHGMASGGQMAFYVGFNARDVFRGVCTVGATLGTAPKDNVANQPLSFFITGGDKDPLIKEIVEHKNLLIEKRFPVIFREMKESGKEYFDETTFKDFQNWIDSLDRI